MECQQRCRQTTGALEITGGKTRERERERVPMTSRFSARSSTLVRGCEHFSLWPDGGCHIQDANASEAASSAELEVQYFMFCGICRSCGRAAWNHIFFFGGVLGFRPFGAPLWVCGCRCSPGRLRHGTSSPGLASWLSEQGQRVSDSYHLLATGCVPCCRQAREVVCLL